MGKGLTRKIAILVKLNAKNLNKGLAESEKKLDRFAQSGSNAGKAIAVGFALATAAATAFIVAAGVFIFSATKVAARTQVLNRVFNLVGKTAGLASQDLKFFKKSIMSLGIAEQEALELQIRFVQSNLDLADSLKIARAAQDLAVIAGENSSETAKTLTNAIVKQRPVLLKQFGILVEMRDIYNKQAIALGKTKTELTDYEKKQAFLNIILEKAATVAGAYEEAMKDVGKQLTSLPRHFQAAQNAIGTLFLPVMKLVVFSIRDTLIALKNLGEFISNPLKHSLDIFDRASSKFDKLSANIDLLSIAYTRLGKKDIPLTTSEQEDLHVITQKLADLVPSAVTEWNKYGEAMGISKDKINDFLEAQKKILKGDFLKNMKDLKKDWEKLAEIDVVTMKNRMNELQDILSEPLDIIIPGINVKDKDLKGLDKAATTRVNILAAATDRIANALKRASNQEEFDLLKLKLKEVKAAQDVLVIGATRGFPLLEKGTQEYTDAITVLNKELVDLAVEHDKLKKKGPPVGKIEGFGGTTILEKLFEDSAKRLRFEEETLKESEVLLSEHQFKKLSLINEFYQKEATILATSANTPKELEAKLKRIEVLKKAHLVKLENLEVEHLDEFKGEDTVLQKLFKQAAEQLNFEAGTLKEREGLLSKYQFRKLSMINEFYQKEAELLGIRPDSPEAQEIWNERKLAIEQAHDQKLADLQTERFDSQADALKEIEAFEKEISDRKRDDLFGFLDNYEEYNERFKELILSIHNWEYLSEEAKNELLLKLDATFDDKRTKADILDQKASLKRFANYQRSLLFSAQKYSTGQFTIQKALAASGVQLAADMAAGELNILRDKFLSAAAANLVAGNFVKAALNTAGAAVLQGGASYIQSRASVSIDAITREDEESATAADEASVAEGGRGTKVSGYTVRGVQNMYIQPSVTFIGETQIIGDTGLEEAAETIGQIAVKAIQDAQETGELAI